MNIALMSHDKKKELMVQFCIAYCGILSKHTICATNSTGKMVAEATGLPIHLFLSNAHGGAQQIGARISYNEIDLVLFFNDPNSDILSEEVNYISRLCDRSNIQITVTAIHLNEPQPWYSYFVPTLWQLFWLAAMGCMGYIMQHRGLKKLSVAGG